MSEVWCFLEGEGQKGLAAEAARLAKQMGRRAGGVVAGEMSAADAEGWGRYGLEKLYLLGSTEGGDLSPDHCVELLSSLLADNPPYVCLFAASALGNEVAARLAVRLGAGLVTGCSDLSIQSGQMVAVKRAYGGNLAKRLAWQGPPPYLATMAPEVLEDIPADHACVLEIVRHTTVLPQDRARLVDRFRLGWQEMPLTEAMGVLGVGAGVGAGAEMDLVDRVAALLDLPVGGTKRADEMGLIARERRIGASGAYIAPEVYLAVGISGASHHLVGIRKAKHVVAINRDRAAPIFEVAELGIVDDYRPVLRALVEELSSR